MYNSKGLHLSSDVCLCEYLCTYIFELVLRLCSRNNNGYCISMEKCFFMNLFAVKLEFLFIFPYFMPFSFIVVFI